MSTYMGMLDAVKNYYGSGSDQWLEIAKYGISADNAEAILSQVPGVQLIKNSDGTIRSYTYSAISSTTGSSIAEEINSNLQTGTASISNNTKIKIPSNMGIDEAGKLTLKSGIKTAGKFVFSEVVPAIAASGVGISLGKTIDKTLYNSNPNFWDSHGMSSLNPETWSSITSGDSSIGASLFNMVFGIDGDNTQAYIDENAYAYLALWLQQSGAFNSGYLYETGNLNDIITVTKSTIDFDTFMNEAIKYWRVGANDPFDRWNIDPSSAITVVKEYMSQLGYNINEYSYFIHWSQTSADLYLIKEGTQIKMLYTGGVIEPYLAPIEAPKGNVIKVTIASTKDHNSMRISSKDLSPTQSIYNFAWDSTLNPYSNRTGTESDFGIPTSASTPPSGSKNANGYFRSLGVVFKPAIDGIGNQTDATIPNLSGLDNVEDTLQYLKELYPDLWNKAVEQEIVQPDGTKTTYKYIPIPMPEGTSSIDIKPVGGEATQNNTVINGDTSTETLIDLITSIITTPPTSTDIPDTGSGDTPPVIIPSGTANALYSIYNPSQNELNSFGSWLWSADFVDQLLKMFNDPMQSIIGLHKIFASPSISGRGNIKVGYLDSGVNTNLVDKQYVTIDCGSVSIKEYFGNVFDYYPYTKIQLYLPFIGIVELDTSDTMRSKVNIKYHIDVLTGACLVEVYVTRDLHGGVLYTYNGNCAVQYPLSSGSYMGIVTGIINAGIGVAVGVGGNPLLGAGMTLSGISGMKTNIKHSGTLSGNTGAMGIKKPYIIITRPQTHVADDIEKFIGYPTNNKITLSNVSGYIKVKYVHVDEIDNAFNVEKDEIERLLKEGVIIA